MKYTRLYAAAVLFGIAVWLLWDVGWKATAGVFLFVWGNNLVYTWRLMQGLRHGVEGWKRPEAR